MIFNPGLMGAVHVHQAFLFQFLQVIQNHCRKINKIIQRQRSTEPEALHLDWQPMDGSLVQAPTRQSTGLSEEGVGRNPTDRGKSGSKIHLLVDQEGMPLGLALAGAHVHNSRLYKFSLTILTMTG